MKEWRGLGVWLRLIALDNAVLLLTQKFWRKDGLFKKFISNIGKKVQFVCDSHMVYVSDHR